MALQADDPRSHAEQIADDLRQRIASGELAAGHRLPSIRKLGEHYHKSPQTVQNAIRELKAEGVVHSRAGKGVFVGPATDTIHDANQAVAPSSRDLMDRLDSFADRLADLDERLAGLEAERDSRRPTGRPAARPKDRTT